MAPYTDLMKKIPLALPTNPEELSPGMLRMRPTSRAGRGDVRRLFEGCPSSVARSDGENLSSLLSIGALADNTICYWLAPGFLTNLENCGCSNPAFIDLTQQAMRRRQIAFSQALEYTTGGTQSFKIDTISPNGQLVQLGNFSM